MRDLHTLTRCMTVRNGTASLVAPSKGVEGIGGDGVCKCGHWDAEPDANGYCRDRDCRADRLVKALQAGKAFRLKDGTLVWQIE